ncbi:MAG: hypothetical protein ACQESH_07700 [Campylobacterota bacterium]
MVNDIKVKHFKKSHLMNILDEIVEPMYQYLQEESQQFESFENQVKAYDLKQKYIYLGYTFFGTTADILEDLVMGIQKQYEDIGVEPLLRKECAKQLPIYFKNFLLHHFNPTDKELELWDKRIEELKQLCMQTYCAVASQKEDDGFFEECYTHDIENLDAHHYSDAQKLDAKTFMDQSEIESEEIAEIEGLIEDLQEYIDTNYQKGLSDELIEGYKDLIAKMIGFYELSGEFRTLTYPMNNLFSMLENLDLTMIDDMMKDVIFNFLSNTVNDMKKWVNEVLIQQSANDIHYLDASLLASISQMEMMIAGSDEQEIDDDDDDFLF